jgi:hypothetical protein
VNYLSAGYDSTRETDMAAISGERATNERVKCLRIFSDGDGETHLEDMDITLQPKKLFKDTPPLGLTENLDHQYGRTNPISTFRSKTYAFAYACGSEIP